MPHTARHLSGSFTPVPRVGALGRREGQLITTKPNKTLFVTPLLTVNYKEEASHGSVSAMAGGVAVPLPGLPCFTHHYLANEPASWWAGTEALAGKQEKRLFLHIFCESPGNSVAFLISNACN